MSVMYQHVQGKAKAALDVNPKLPKELADLIMKAMSVDKAKRLIGYQPQYPLEKGFPRYIDWYKQLSAEHPDYFN